MRFKLPTDKGAVEIASKFSLDVDTFEDQVGYFADSNKWLVPGANPRYDFFIMPDPNYLSGFEFSFDYFKRSRTPK